MLPDVFQVTSSTSAPDTISAAESWTRKLFCATAKLPSAVFLSGVKRVTSFPFSGGGYADVFRGLYEDKHVALKVLRTFGNMDSNEVKRLHEVGGGSQQHLL